MDPTELPPDRDAAEDELTRPMSFIEHRDRTAADLDQFADIIKTLAASVREGNMQAFEKFWIENGTEEGDAKLFALHEIMVLRYFHRANRVTDGIPPKTPGDNPAAPGA